MKIILHIGSEKTGTSSIRSALNHNRSLLLEQGILFPDYPPVIGHRILRVLFFGAPNPDQPVYKHFPKGQAQAIAYCWKEWQRIEASVSKLQPNTLVLSCETLFQMLDETADKIINRLFSISSEIEIVLYLRHPEVFAVSFASQAFKHRLSLDLSVLERKLDYSGIVASYERRLNRSVSVYMYDESCQTSGSVVGHFFARVLNVDLPKEATQIFVNVTPSPESLEIIQEYYSKFYGKSIWQFNGYDYSNIGIILKVENVIGKAPIVLTDVAKEWLRQRLQISAFSKQVSAFSFQTSSGSSLANKSVVSSDVNLRDFFILNDDKLSAILNKIEAEMPIFWASYGSTRGARLWRMRLKIFRYVRTLLDKLRRALK